jgi:hypothetical protein
MLDNNRIKQIIKEELRKVLKEDLDPAAGHTYSTGLEGSADHSDFGYVSAKAQEDAKRWVSQLDSKKLDYLAMINHPGYVEIVARILGGNISRKDAFELWSQFTYFPQDQLGQALKKTGYVSTVPKNYMSNSPKSSPTQPQKQSLGTILDPKAAKLNKIVNPSKPSKLGKILGT